jgi:hypothetical protein
MRPLKVSPKMLVNFMEMGDSDCENAHKEDRSVLKQSKHKITVLLVSKKCLKVINFM